MYSKEEKLSLLTEMIAFARADNEMTEIEYNFLLGVAQQIDIDKQELDTLLENPAPHRPMKSEGDRIVQFHRLVLLMNVDQHIREEELIKLHEFGLKMGLNPQAINKVLEVMPNYENNVVPPQVLLDIFKTYYN